MTPTLLVHGTWSRGAGWYAPGSPLWKALTDRGFIPIQFRWSGYCGGVPGPIIVPPSTDQCRGDLELWRSEGEKLALFCRMLDLKQPSVISHSHGLQLVAFAACGTDFVMAQTFATVLSLSGPVRKDMRWTRERARSHIQRWVQVTDPAGDATIRAGEGFDGHLGWAYELPEADVNIAAPGQGHSGMTTDIEAWTTLGLWDAMQETLA